jgi:hypothetical protein
MQRDGRARPQMYAFAYAHISYIFYSRISSTPDAAMTRSQEPRLCQWVVQSEDDV